MRLENIIPNKRLPYRQALLATTLRGFSGGWNLYDDDMSMAYRFATRMRNVYPAADGKIKVRFGTKLFADCTASFTTTSKAIINIEYFNNALIVVGAGGQVLKIDGAGVITRIWDTAIAATRPGAPAAWGTTAFVSFAQFNGDLILCNGSDKPLIISKLFVVNYLKDLATGSNVNVPICRYVVALNRYLIMSGDILQPARVHFSAKDASGTWFGDPAPNDGTRIDVGSILAGATTIRGLMQFRGKLIVMFAEGLIFGSVGGMTGTAHTPLFEDSVAGYGSISHRAGIAYGDDGLFMDLEGVPSIKRTVLSASFKPERVSDLIDSQITSALAPLGFVALEDRVFSVYNKIDGQFMLFIPNSNDVGTTTETMCSVYNYRPSLRQEAWAEFRGWNFTCATRSLGGLLFFGDFNGKVWQYGRTQDNLYTDYMQPVVNPAGNLVSFDWEMPWLDFGNRAISKHSKYLSFDTRGSAPFTVRMYTDNILVTADGVTDNPTLSMLMVAGENTGGARPPLTGVRNTARKKLHAWPTKFQIAKLRFSGSVSSAMEFVSITLHYQNAGINR